MTTKTIASSGGDYATMQLAEAGLAAFDAGADMTDAWVFNVANEIINESSNTTWSGAYGGLSSTNTITIQPGATFGFASNNDYTTVALDYNGTAGKGAGFSQNNTASQISFNAHMVIQGLQFRCDRSYLLWLGIAGGGNTIFRRNIYRAENDGCSQLDSNASAGSVLIANNAFIHTNKTASNDQATIYLHGSCTWEFCFNTIVRTRGATDGASCIRTNGATAFKAFQNLVYFNDATNSGPYRAGYSTDTGDYNLSNGVGDVAGLSNSGGHTSTSGVLANDITDGSASATGEAVDLRPKAGGLALAFIPSASAYNPAGIAANEYLTDIRGQTRVGVDNDCGCFQKTAAAAGGILKHPTMGGGMQNLTGGMFG